MRNILLTSLTLTIALVSPLLQAKPAEECLGRLVFTVPDINNFEWAMNHGHGMMTFDKKVYIGESNWYYGPFSINVTSSRPYEDFNYRFKNYEISRQGRINRIEKELKTKKGVLEDLTKLRQEQQQELAQGKKFKHYEIITENKLQEWQSQVTNLQSQLDYFAKHPLIKVPLDYPEAFTVYNDTAYFWRDNRIYTFANTDRKAKPTLTQLNESLAGFSPRQLGEIPNSLGFCFPYGFMADAGDTDYEIKNAFRFKDQPNVLYAFYTGTVRHAKIDILNNPMLVELGKVAKYGFADNGISLKIENFQDHKQQQTISLGELGEIELTIDSMIEKNPVDPKDPVTAYIITGAIRDTYDNKVADKTKPYIGFQIYGYPKNTGEDYNLPQNPPTPEQAIAKVVPLLKTLRLDLQAAAPNRN